MFDDLSIEELRKLARAKKRLLELEARGAGEVNTARLALAALWAIRGGLPEQSEGE